jgi:hypothetical protein
MSRRTADEKGMRSRRIATALVVTVAGLTVSAALRRLRTRRASAPPVVRAPAVQTPVVQAPVVHPPVVADTGRGAVILSFARPATVPASAPLAERPAAPARCGDNGGRTKAGAPCAARATSGGRCHHHPLAA